MREQAEPIAARYGVAMVVRDVDSDAVLEQSYGERVPVLLLGSPPNGIELCHYRLDVAALERALAAP